MLPAARELRSNFVQLLGNINTHNTFVLGMATEAIEDSNFFDPPKARFIASKMLKKVSYELESGVKVVKGYININYIYSRDKSESPKLLS